MSEVAGCDWAVGGWEAFFHHNGEEEAERHDGGGTASLFFHFLAPCLKLTRCDGPGPGLRGSRKLQLPQAASLSLGPPPRSWWQSGAMLGASFRGKPFRPSYSPGLRVMNRASMLSMLDGPPFRHSDSRHMSHLPAHPLFLAGAVEGFCHLQSYNTGLNNLWECSSQSADSTSAGPVRSRGRHKPPPNRRDGGQSSNTNKAPTDDTACQSAYLLHFP